MPLYEYKCVDCGSKFEELVSGSDTQVACPKCGSSKAERQLSVFSASGSSSSASSLPCGKSSCNSGFS